MQPPKPTMRPERRASTLLAGLATLALVIALSITSRALVQETPPAAEAAAPADQPDTGESATATGEPAADAGAASPQRQPSSESEPPQTGLVGEPKPPTSEEPSADPNKVTEPIIIETGGYGELKIVRDVLKSLDDEKLAVVESELDRVGKPVTLHAQIAARADTPFTAVVDVIKSLREAGIREYSLRPAGDSAKSRVIVIAPASITWRQVKQIEEALAKHSQFESDVRVAANNDPVTPTVPGVIEPEKDAPPPPPQSGSTSAGQAGQAAGEPAASAESGLVENANAARGPIVIDATGFGESTVLQELVNALQRQNNEVSLVKDKTNRAGKPFSFYAELTVRPDIPVLALVDAVAGLRKVGVDEYALKTSADGFNKVVVTAPPGFSGVKKIEQSLAGNTSFDDVQIVGAAGAAGEAAATTFGGSGGFGGFGGLGFGENYAGAIQQGTAMGIPASAIPGRTWVDGGKLIIAISDDGKQAFAYSELHPRWAAQPLADLPGVNPIPIVGSDVAVVWHGHFSHAYSSSLGTWDTLTLPADELAQPLVSSDSVIVKSKQRGDFVFKNHWGKWFSAEQIKSGKVAEHLAGMSQRSAKLPAATDDSDQSTQALREKYHKLEQQTRKLAERARNMSGGQGSRELNAQLRAAVQQAYDVRLQLHQAELAEFTQRLQDIERSLGRRQSLRSRIIERRVEELLDPDLQWQPPADKLPAVRPSVRKEPAESSALGAGASEYASPATDPNDIDIQVRQVPLKTVLWNLVGAIFDPVTDSDELSGTEWKRGLRVTQLQPSGPAAEAGLQVGDIVVGVDRAAVGDLADIDRAWQDSLDGAPARVTFLRDKATYWAKLTWANSILKPSLAEGKVLSRDGKQIEVSLGMKDGVHPGERLHVWSGGLIPNIAEVMLVQEDRLRARIWHEGVYNGIEPGQRVTYGSIELSRPPEKHEPTVQETTSGNVTK